MFQSIPYLCIMFKMRSRYVYGINRIDQFLKRPADLVYTIILRKPPCSLQIHVVYRCNGHSIHK